MSDQGAPIKVIAKAADLVDALATHGPMTPAEVAERIDVPRSSAYRLVDGLTAIGLVESTREGKARLSLRWLGLADATREALTEWSGAAEALEHLVHATGQTAFLSVLVGEEAVCIDWRPGLGIDVLALKPGRSLPLYAGAAGRVLLAFSPDTEDHLGRTSLTALTSETIVDADALRADVELTRERGYALSEQDVSVGISAIGVPVFREGSLVGCVSIGGLSRAFGPDPERFVPALERAVALLTAGFAAS